MKIDNQGGKIEFITPEMLEGCAAAKEELIKYRDELAEAGQLDKDISQDPVVNEIIDKYIKL